MCISTANWDPYPMANEIEAFTNAIANMDAAIAQRIERFSDRGPTAFFTGIYPEGRADAGAATPVAGHARALFRLHGCVGGDSE